MKTSNDKLAFETVIQQLSTNSPDMKEFSLGKIIHDDDLFKLAEAFKKNHTLERIIIDGSDSSRELRSTEAGAIAIGESLKDHPKLESIEVELETQFQEKQIFGFLQSLTGSANIKRLKINICCDYEFLNKLGDLLTKKKSVEHIDISGGQLKKREEHKPFPLKNFFAGIGVQHRLSHLYLIRIILDKQDLNELVFAMRNINSLTTIGFRGCQIPPSEVKHLSYIVKNNPLLSTLDLSGNPLEDIGIEEIIQILPSLKKLKTLSLRAVGLTNKSLKSLVSTFLEEKLCISALSLCTNPMDKDSILLINQLIDANPRLKNLSLAFCGINDEHIQKMVPILKDPNRCLLETFFFGDHQNWMPSSSRNFIQIMDQNENICLFSPRMSDEQIAACDINRAKIFQQKRDTFIDATICLSQAHFAPTKSDIKQLPSIMILCILAYLVPDTNSKTDSPLLCRDLIFNNFKNRNILMKEGKYLPSIDLKKDDIENNHRLIKQKWWSIFITEGKDNIRTLLVPTTTLYPYYLKLGEIVSIVESTFLKNYKASGKKEVNIDISKLNNADQLRILVVFKRFFRIKYEYRTKEKSPSIYLTDNGILKIEGISSLWFRLLIEQTKKTVKPVLETKSNCHCLIM